MKKGNNSGSGRNERKSANNRWHAIAAEKVVQSLETDGEKGLDEKEAEKRLETYGPNKMPEKRKRTWWQRLLAQFTNVLIYVLIGAAVITALMDHWVDTWVILAVVLINAVIGFIQEGKAESALKSIQQMLSLEANVMRGGKKKTIDAVELVPGDLVMVKAGDKVPADMRLVKSKDLRVEESPLTGESSAVEKNTEAVEEDAVVGDRFSMVFSGTVVTYGKATGVVVGTGEETEIGKINKMMSEVEEITTPLLQKIDRFGKYLSLAILGITALFFLYGYLFAEYELYELLMAVIALIVASIPEGLPAIMTITLALGVQRMAGRNAIIRRLPAVETLGSVTVICSDKTGTLTKNEITVREIVLPDGKVSVSGTGYEPEGEFEKDGKPVDPAEHGGLVTLIRAGGLCNDAEIRRDEEKGYVIEGDPTEGAMVALARKAGLDRGEEKRSYPRIDVIPFESEHRFMATLHQQPDGGNLIFLKGAPEAVLSICETQGRNGDREELDRDFWEEQIEFFAREGHRVLGLAVTETDKTEIDMEDVKSGMVLLGFVGMVDPPRPEAVSAVNECLQAGIRVKMITGDHALTARTIGYQMGIGDGEKAITGSQLEEMSDGELARAVLDYDIFARSSPEHKLRLVKALQSHGEVVAMTGDGVNDAPALKRADVGVAMGIKGSEASKEAAAMVLADDNFASIEHAVEEGRTIYDNLKKTILFILPTNGAEALMVLATVFFAFSQLPITPVQILWVNMVTAVTLALALAFEPSEKGIMRRPPRDSEEPIVSGYLLWRICFVSVVVACFAIGLFFLELENGVSLLSARTVAVNVLVAGQLFYLFNSRFIMQSSLSLRDLISNRAALIASGMLVFFQLAFTYFPPLQLWFGTEAIGPVDWLFVIGAGAAVFVLVEVEKAMVRRIKKQ